MVYYSRPMRNFLQGIYQNDLTPLELYESLSIKDISLPAKVVIKQLKHALQIQDESIQDYEDLFYDTLTELMGITNQETCDKVYFVPNSKTKIIIKEDVASISKGTTGLCTWSASLHLIEYLERHRDLLDGKILELGSGAGLLGFMIEKIACSTVADVDGESQTMSDYAVEGRTISKTTNDSRKSSIIMTDLNHYSVIQRLEENKNRNQSQAQIMVLDWIDNHLDNHVDNPDYLIKGFDNISAIGARQADGVGDVGASTFDKVKRVEVENLNTDRTDKGTEVQNLFSKRQCMVEQFERSDRVEVEGHYPSKPIYQPYNRVSKTSAEIQNPYIRVSNNSAKTLGPNGRVSKNGTSTIEPPETPDGTVLNKSAYAFGSVDLLIGADVVFDPVIIPYLVQTLRRVKFKTALISCTIRNQETFQGFLDCLAHTGLEFKILGFENTDRWFFYPEILPIKIVKIHGHV